MTPPSLAHQLLDLAKQINDREPLQPDFAQTRALHLAVAVAPGIRWATCTISRGRRASPYTSASSSDIASALDELQFGSGEGPCLEALATGAIVLAADLKQEKRWPGFTLEAVRTSPARTVFSYPFAAAGAPSTTLNFYGDDPAVLTSQQADVATVAAGAALVMAAIAVRERADNLAQAMVSNRQIGAATGILMSQNGWTQMQAFAAIRRRSQHEHVKLREVAEQIVAGATPPQPPADSHEESGSGHVATP